MNNDLHNSIDQIRVIGPVAIGANATKTGVIVDRRGFGGVEFVCAYGAVTTTGTVCTVVVKEGDVTGTFLNDTAATEMGTVALAGLLATTPRTSGVSQNVAKRIGYKGTKRYVQVNAVSTGVTSVGCVSVTALLFNPAVAPLANP